MKNTEPELKKNECDDIGRLSDIKHKKYLQHVRYRRWYIKKHKLKSNETLQYSNYIPEYTDNGIPIIKSIKYKYIIRNKLQVWIRNCPVCKTELNYTNYRGMVNASKLKSWCGKCQSNKPDNHRYRTRHTEEHKKYLSDAQKECSFKYKKIGHNPPKIKRICKTCDTIYWVVNSHRRSNYCSYKCAAKDNYGFKHGHMTSPERKFSEMLDKIKEPYKYGFYLEGKLYDFYIPRKNRLIEIDGSYWHGKNLKLKQRNDVQRRNYYNDKLKNKIALTNGYSIVRIWDDELKEENVSKYIQ